MVTYDVTQSLTHNDEDSSAEDGSDDEPPPPPPPLTGPVCAGAAPRPRDLIDSVARTRTESDVQNKVIKQLSYSEIMQLQQLADEDVRY